MMIVRARGGEVLFRELPIRMLAAGVEIAIERAIAYWCDDARRRVDAAISDWRRPV